MGLPNLSPFCNATISIPKRMKAAVLRDWDDLRYEDFETPGYGSDEILCRVKGCGICGTDLHVMKGHFKGVFPPKLPFIMGHEWYGEVVAIGNKVEGFSLGQRVIGEVQKGCGACARCLEGRYHLCINSPDASKGYRLYGYNINGAYAEYISVNATNLQPMPDNLGMEEGVSALNVAIGIHAVRRGCIDIGDNVVIIGLGLFGLIVLQLAKILGAGKIIAIGGGYRLQMAGEMGADDKVDRTRCNAVEQVKELTKGIGADVVFECAGTAEAVQNALGCVRRGGRVVIGGISGKKGIPLNADQICQDEIDVVGSRGGPNALPESIKLLASGRINAKPLVTHSVPLSEVHKGLHIFTNRLENVIRVALIP